ncbi:unnamed protein product [Cuscuta campestris]|uniref:CRAL-TRIO domain-containing protein n=1 Tax=Cuscuta campestris TaxID=132261 RepID=A0A484NQ13_9ASTE|nr:unnamed protein product [Cuscuta campestris]
MRLSFCRKRGMSKSISRDAILSGCHDTTDQQRVEEFRTFLSQEPSLVGKEPDDHTILRFLRMRGFDKEKAKEVLLNYLKWREEFEVDKICKGFKFDEYEKVKKCYPHGFHGVDKHGRPVYIERIGMVDVHKLLKVTTLERFVKYHVTEQEKTLNLRFPACSAAAKKHIASTTSIFDVKDVGMSNFSKNARNLFWKIQKIDSCYYPETLHRLFIVNAGPGFTLLWKLIKPFIEQRTQVKIQVLEDIKNLAEVIDPSNLPTFLDGHCTCTEYGGCLFSDKGPWNDPYILDSPQGMRNTEEQRENHVSPRDVFGYDAENLHIKDVYDVTPERAPGFRKPEEAQVSHLPLVTQKIQKVESVICDANAKFQTLEAALKDTKLVLQGLVEHMEDLREMIIVTNNAA